MFFDPARAKDKANPERGNDGGMAALTFALLSSRAAIGLLMLFTNLLTCSKCLVISVASTMSMTACRSVRNWFLPEAKGVKANVCVSFTIKRATSGGNGEGRGGQPVGVLEDVALAVAHGELEGEGGVVALQHGRVVVEDGQLAPGVTQEGIGPPRVVHVVHRGRDQSGDLVQLVQAALDETAGGGGTPSVPGPRGRFSADCGLRPLTLTLSERRK